MSENMNVQFSRGQAIEGAVVSPDVQMKVFGQVSPHEGVAMARSAFIGGLIIAAINKGVPLDVAANMLNEGITESH